VVLDIISHFFRIISRYLYDDKFDVQLPKLKDFAEFDNIFSDSFKEYEPVLTKVKEEFNFESKFQNVNKDTPFQDVLFIFLEFFMNSLRVKEMRYFYLSLFKDFVNNYRDLFDRTPLIDKKLYTQMKRFIDKANEMDSEKTHQVIESYYTQHEQRLPLFSIMNSILIFREKIDIDELIVSSNKMKYKEYMNNWILNFGQLIESHIKDILLFFVKLKKVFQNKGFSYLDKRQINMGFLIHELDLNDPVFSIGNYRNAIAHQDYNINFGPEIDDKKLTFKDRKLERSITIDEYIIRYYKLFFFIYTFEIVLNNYNSTHQQQLEDVLHSLVQLIERELPNLEEKLDQMPPIDFSNLQNKINDKNTVNKKQNESQLHPKNEVN